MDKIPRQCNLVRNPGWTCTQHIHVQDWKIYGLTSLCALANVFYVFIKSKYYESIHQDIIDNPVGITLLGLVLVLVVTITAWLVGHTEKISLWKAATLATTGLYMGSDMFIYFLEKGSAQ